MPEEAMPIQRQPSLGGRGRFGPCFPMASLLFLDTLGIEARASRMLSGCDTTTPRALEMMWRPSF